MPYNFNVKLATPRYTIEIDESAAYGYFEHNELGEDRAGGLWFKDKALIDYDGVFDLPKQVVNACIAAGYDMSFVTDTDTL